MCPELPPVAFHGRMHSYHLFTIPPTRASVGAFHAHEGDDGDEEGDEKEAVNIVCERGCLKFYDSLWTTYQWSSTPAASVRNIRDQDFKRGRRPFLASIWGRRRYVNPRDDVTPPVLHTPTPKLMHALPHARSIRKPSGQNLISSERGKGTLKQGSHGAD